MKSACFCLIFFLSVVLLTSPAYAQSVTNSDVKFTKHVISPEFISEGVAVGDVNKDGKLDILAGAYWFEAPDWKPHALDTPQTFSVDQGYSNSFLNFCTDINADGWPDLVRVDFPGKGVYWYENPQAADKYWKSYLIHPTVCNESPAMVDVDHNGTTDLLFSDKDQGQITWMKAVKKNTGVVWEATAISKAGAPGTHTFSHGLGLGDINGDGRKDVMVREGWWEAPENRKNSGWKFHEADLGKDCAQMHTYDFDHDGDQDVVASSAHNYGIWWYEQYQDEQGRTLWKTHLIFDKFSQSHSLALVDINGDAMPDLVTGKRHFAHNGKDPGGHEPALMYWFEYQYSREEGPRWIPHLIDDNSGSGLQVVVEDMNSDSLPDIVVANKKGVHYFEQLKY